PQHHRHDDPDRRGPSGHARRRRLGQRQQPAGPGRRARGHQRRLHRLVDHHRGARAGAPLGPGAWRLLRPDRLRGLPPRISPKLYRPDYPGLTDAAETIRHIMASGASVDETLFQAINSPFFGEREAIKLAFGADGTPTSEQTTPHYTMASAQPLVLQSLVVP